MEGLLCALLLTTWDPQATSLTQLLHKQARRACHATFSSKNSQRSYLTKAAAGLLQVFGVQAGITTRAQTEPEVAAASDNKRLKQIQTAEQALEEFKVRNPGPEHHFDAITTSAMQMMERYWSPNSLTDF